MNCDMACHLMDDYLENRLGRRERQQLERHLSLCTSCTEELRHRPDFDHQMWRALVGSVQNLRLSPEASSEIVEAAQNSVRRGIRSKRAVLTLQLMASATVVILMVAGMLIVMGRLPVPSTLIELSEPSIEEPAVYLSRNDIIVEPSNLHPGEPFTTTIFFHSDLSESVDAVRFKLNIDGPSGKYEFALALQGPFPAQEVSVLRVTPETLAGPCWDQYQIAPEDIISEPGAYTFRAALVSPVTIPEK